MLWVVTGLSCGQIGKVNSRLSTLLARTGEKAIVLFCFVFVFVLFCFLRLELAGGWNYEAACWGPQRFLMSRANAWFLFLCPRAVLPRPHSWQLSQAPTSAEEGIPSPWPHQNASPTPQASSPPILHQPRPLLQTEWARYSLCSLTLNQDGDLLWGVNHPQKQSGLEQVS